MNISTAEPDDFELPDHFEDCRAYSDEDAYCTCPKIADEIRAEFILNKRKCW